MNKSSGNMDPFKMENDPKNYKFSLIYWNKDDKRIFVPKSVPWMGWTMNFANPVSYVILLLLILAIYLIELMA